MRAPLRTIAFMLAAACAGAGATIGAAVEPPPAASAAATTDLTARILDLERQGRSRPTETAARLDQLSAATAPYSAERLELLTVQGMMLVQASQLEPAERPAALLEAWGRDTGAPLAPRAAAAALLIRARGMARNGNLQRADAMLAEALDRLPAGLPTRDRYRYMLAQGYIHNEAGQLEEAVRSYHEALALADRQDQPWRQAEVRTQLAYAYYDAKQYESAQTLVNEALLLAERNHDDVALGRANSVAGIILDGLGDPAAQGRAFERAIEYARRAGSKFDEVSYLANLSDSYLKNGDYRTALARAERALVLARELHDAGSETVALANIGLAQISLQHIEQGKRNVHAAMAIDTRRGSVTGQADILRELGVYLEKAGDYAGAIEAYHEHRRLATLLIRDDQQKAILSMQAQYDADHRNRALKLLARENEIKAEQLRRRDLQQRLWALLGAAALLALAVVALLVRRVRRANRLLVSSNELLKVQSERDPLTGLANRRHFQAVMRRLTADGRFAGTIYLVDIDHFKHVNDRYGHAIGDAVLVEVARRLRETLREEDLIVRWGGEEFLVVVQDLAAEPVDALAKRMLGALDLAPVCAGVQRIPVSASIGYATFPIGPSRLHVAWERAIDLVDTAMYLAKAHGRNRAYGVRVLEATDEATLDALIHSLEAAWRDGRVALTLLEGRTPLAVAA